MRSIALTHPSVGGLAALALAACTPMSQQQGETPAVEDQRQETEVASDAAGSQPMQAMLDQIRSDAAQRAGVAPDKVQILTVQSVTWADGSLGCPEPGMLYTQALVRGHRIEVNAAGATLVYHSGPQNRFVHCPPERAQPPSLVDPT
jgi:hypothetical protein